jgi:hypothetical protein
MKSVVETTEDKNFVVYVNDFGDTYHDMTREMSELEVEANNLRNKYTRVVDYNEAMVVYDNYIDYLIDKYGGLKRFAILFSTGGIEEYVPSKPKLKTTKTNKFMLKNKIVLTRIPKFMNISDDIKDTEKSIDDYEKEVYGEDYVPKFIMKNKSKDKFGPDMERKEKKGKKSQSAYLDFMDSYLYQRKGLTSSKANKDIKKPGLVDIINETKTYKRWVKAQEGTNENDVFFIDGRYYSKKDMEQYNLTKLFSECGVDPYKLYKMKGSSHSLVRLIKDNEKRSKKEKKRNKKKTKEADSFLNQVMAATTDYDSFEDFQRDFLNMNSTLKF